LCSETQTPNTKGMKKRKLPDRKEWSDAISKKIEEEGIVISDICRKTGLNVRTVNAVRDGGWESGALASYEQYDKVQEALKHCRGTK